MGDHMNDEESALVRNVQHTRADTSSLNFFEFPMKAFDPRCGPITVVDETGASRFIDPQYYRQRRRDDAVPTLTDVSST